MSSEVPKIPDSAPDMEASLPVHQEDTQPRDAGPVQQAHGVQADLHHIDSDEQDDAQRVGNDQDPSMPQQGPNNVGSNQNVSRQSQEQDVMACTAQDFRASLASTSSSAPARPSYLLSKSPASVSTEQNIELEQIEVAPEAPSVPPSSTETSSAQLSPICNPLAAPRRATTAHQPGLLTRLGANSMPKDHLWITSLLSVLFCFISGATLIHYFIDATETMLALVIVFGVLAFIFTAVCFYLVNRQLNIAHRVAPQQCELGPPQHALQTPPEEEEDQL